MSDIFAYSCPEVSCDPVLVRFLLIPAPRSVVTPRQSELSAGGTKREVENTPKMYPPQLYPNPTIQSRSAARRAA